MFIIEYMTEKIPESVRPQCRCEGGLPGDTCAALRAVQVSNLQLA
jgi:hypothetical protein